MARAGGKTLGMQVSELKAATNGINLVSPRQPLREEPLQLLGKKELFSPTFTDIPRWVR